jgi:hypothetical protein
MKISELLSQLQSVLDMCGDLEIYVGTRYAISYATGIDFGIFSPGDPPAMLIEGEDDEDLHKMVTT